MFEFYIDGIKYSNPINWADFTETIEFDEANTCLVFKYNNSLVFTGSAYSYLYDKKISEGFCYIAELKIKYSCTGGGSFENIFTGKIFLSDCKFNLTKCSVECDIEDNNYSALIFNNKTVKVMMYEQVKSKNLFTINPTYANSANYLNITSLLFNPANGSQLASGSGYIVFPHDAFKLLVAFLTDDLIDFRSDYLNYSLPIITENDKVKKLSIVKGDALRNRAIFTGYENLVISFSELFKEINKIYPIYMYIEYTTSGKPILRIEEFSTLRLNQTSVNLDNVNDILEYIDGSSLIGNIIVGGQSAEYNSSIHSYPPTKQLTFEQENNYIDGQCNNDIEKNISSDYIMDTNIIEELLVTNTSDTTYDKNTFFLELEATNTPNIWKATKTPNYNDPTKYHYNDNLLNVNIIKRNTFHNPVSINSGVGVDLSNESDSSVGGSLGIQSNLAGGSMPVTQVGAYSNIQYFIDNAAVFNGFNYTALFAGEYTFEINPYTEAITCTNRIFYVELQVRRYNSSNVLQETQSKTYGSFSAVGYYNLSIFYPSFTMAVGDYVTTYINYSSQPIDFTLNSTMQLFVLGGTSRFGNFNTGSTPNNSGLVANNDVMEYFSSLLTFNYPIPRDKYEIIKNNLSKNISLNIGRTIKKGWIKSIETKLATGDSSLNLISNINNTR